MRWFFAFFVLSGFCGLVYQVVWLRVAMASFGVTTPLVSIVLSVFMAGLALGSWEAGRLARRLGDRDPAIFLRLYAAMEGLIGLSGIVVAPLLRSGHAVLATSQGGAWGSTGYYLASGAWITLCLLPFCLCMGATFPFAMAAIRPAFPAASPRSFSFLYVANVFGAMTGALGSAFILIELLGFRKTLLVASVANAVVAIAAVVLSVRSAASVAPQNESPRGAQFETSHESSGVALAFLFTTGLASLALEVVWTRQFVPFQGPLVYAFATMLAVYLASTLTGSLVYRTAASSCQTFPVRWSAIGIIAGASGLLALCAADPRVPLPFGLLSGGLRIVAGIAPFCGILGFLTPMLVDRISRGNPDRAGIAYAINTCGCIVGPLISGFVLLPRFGERWTTLILVLPLFAFTLAGFGRRSPSPLPRSVKLTRITTAAAGIAAALVILFTRDFETIYAQRIVRRDHTATVIATGSGRGKQLLVNGYGMTTLTPITKTMVHFPLASLPRKPHNGLVLCLGMGTSFRSMLTWGIPTTAVELVPSIPGLLGFFHADGEKVRQNPLGRIVVDDARRFLERSGEIYDVIVIDPPPPVEAAGSSLLYSDEFCASARLRLASDGILQHWLPTGDAVIVSGVARSLMKSFPYVRVFTSVEGWGYHFLASGSPIPIQSPEALAARLPKAAAKDLVEWGPASSPAGQFDLLLQREMPVRRVIDQNPTGTILTDDLPVNEYYFLRKSGKW